MRKLICGVFCSILLTVGIIPIAKAQDGDTIQPQKKALILKMMEIAGTKKYLETMTKMVEDQFKDNFPKYAEVLMEEFKGYINYDSIVTQFLPLYAKHFSEDDLSAIIAFYNSPVGDKMRTEMPKIMEESAEVTKKRSKILQEKVMQRLQELEEQNKEKKDSSGNDAIPQQTTEPPAVLEGGENAAPAL